MSVLSEVTRDEIAVQFVRVPDGIEHIRRACYARIGPTFDELTREAKPDTSRPSLEHYRRHDEIHLLLPIA
jgi:hypothetical protein